jgi:hypothetical protein
MRAARGPRRPAVGLCLVGLAAVLVAALAVVHARHFAGLSRRAACSRCGESLFHDAHDFSGRASAARSAQCTISARSVHDLQPPCTFTPSLAPR